MSARVRPHATLTGALLKKTFHPPLFVKAYKALYQTHEQKLQYQRGSNKSGRFGSTTMGGGGGRENVAKLRHCRKIEKNPRDRPLIANLAGPLLRFVRSRLDPGASLGFPVRHCVFYSGTSVTTIRPSWRLGLARRYWKVDRFHLKTVCIESLQKKYINKPRIRRYSSVRPI